jgi:hypothetical protein
LNGFKLEKPEQCPPKMLASLKAFGGWMWNCFSGSMSWANAGCWRPPTDLQPQMLLEKLPPSNLPLSQIQPYREL